MRSFPLVLLLLVLARVLFLSACCWLAVLLSCLLLALLFSSSFGPLLTSCKSALLTGPLCVHSPLEMTRRDVHPRVDQPSTWVTSHPHTSSRAAREGLLSVSRVIPEIVGTGSVHVPLRPLGCWTADGASRRSSESLRLSAAVAAARGCVVATLVESYSFCLWFFLCFLLCHLVVVYRSMDASSGTSKHHYAVLRHCVIVGSRWMLPCSTVGQVTTTCSTVLFCHLIWPASSRSPCQNAAVELLERTLLPHPSR